MRRLIERLACRLARHRHGQARILVNYREGGMSTSHIMDAWDADWVVANVISPTATWNGRAVASCRVVVL